MVVRQMISYESFKTSKHFLLVDKKREEFITHPKTLEGVYAYTG